MTKLKDIAANHFSVQCICGHQALIRVSDLIELRGDEMHVDEVELKARCTRCKSKGMFQRFQIIYVGASYDAMRMSHTPEEERKNY